MVFVFVPTKGQDLMVFVFVPSKGRDLMVFVFGDLMVFVFGDLMVFVFVPPKGRDVGDVFVFVCVFVLPPSRGR